MSTSTVSAPSPERMAPAQKPNTAKNSTAATAALPGQFAALLLQADETVDLDAITISPKTSGKDTDTTETAGKAAARTPAEDEPLPGSEAALLGLLTWRNYAPAPLPSTVATGSSTPALPPQTLSAVNQALANTTTLTGAPGQSLLTSTQPALTATASSSMAMLKSPTTDAASASMPTHSQLLTASAPSALGVTLPATEAPSQSLAGTGQTDSGHTATQSAGPSGAQSAKPGAGLPPAAAAGIETSGAKTNKPSAAKLALNAIQGASSATSNPMSPAASTVSLASKSALTEPSGMAARSAIPRATAALSEAASVPRSDTTETEGSGPSVAIANPVDPSAPPMGAGADGAGAGADTSAASMPTADAPQATPAHDAMEQTMERLSAQVSYWASQGSQRASLTIADDQAGPIDVSISFEKGEVSVHFETDEDAVREALQSGAEDILNRLLEAKGMTLGSVSIGLGQNDNRQPPQQQSAPSDTESGRTRLQQATSATGEPAAMTPRRSPDIISANKLDFFA